MDYGNVVQQLRLGQSVPLALSAIILYAESDRIGLTGFLIPAALIFIHLYLVLTRWHKQVDGRFDFEGILTGSNAETQIHYAVQVFAPFVLAVAVHFLAPVITSSSSSLIFNISHYVTILAAAVVLALDVYGGMKKKYA